jgi:hypothetical protein
MDGFVLPDISGLETRQMLSADYPMGAAEVAEPVTEYPPARPDRDIIEQSGPAYSVVVRPTGVRFRMLDLRFVKPEYDAFRQMQGGSDHYSTTVNESLSVKFGSPIEAMPADQAGMSWNELKDSASTLAGDHFTLDKSASGNFTFSYGNGGFLPPLVLSQQNLTLLIARIERRGPLPLIQNLLPSFLISGTVGAMDPESPKPKPDSIIAAIPNSENASTEDQKPQVARQNNAPSPVWQPSVHDARAASNGPVVSENESLTFGDGAISLQIRRDGDDRPRSDSLATDVTQTGKVSELDETREDHKHPGVWNRISEAFELDDADFGPIGGEPLDESVEIDANELSAAVDRILEGFVYPVEESLSSQRLGRTIGMAAGAAIALQVIMRKRKNTGFRFEPDESDSTSGPTHVSPNLDQLDDSEC